MPLQWTEKCEVGLEERRAILVKRIPGFDRVLDTELDDAHLPTYSMPLHCYGRREGPSPGRALVSLRT